MCPTKEVPATVRANVMMAAAGVVVAACVGADNPAAVDAAQFARGAPDLIVDAQWLARSWVVYDQDLNEDPCSLVEGGVTPGVHHVLRFTVSTPNIGNADVFIGNPLDHVAANDGLCHMVKERRYDNNVAQVRITIPGLPAPTGFGPGSADPPDGELIDQDPHCSPHPGGVVCGVWAAASY